MLQDMFESLLHSFWRQPKRAIAAGRIILNGAFFWMLVGLLANFSSRALSIVSVTAREANAAQAPISKILPGLPTWWIPESEVSFVLLIALGAMGAWLVFAGKRLDRLMRLYD